MTKLNELDLFHKVSITGFLVVFALGIGVTGILYSSTSGRFSAISLFSPGLVRLKYSASPLERALRTTMREYVKSDADVETICRWLKFGGDRLGYYESASPIIQRDCSHCHGKIATIAGVGALYTYADVLPYAKTRGVPIEKLSLRSHVHLFGIGLLLLILTSLANRTSMPHLLKLATSISLFGLLTTDVLSQYLAKLSAIFAYIVWMSGLLFNLFVIISILLILCDIWLRRSSGDIQ
ncbi:TPA: hypothetical protein EYP66_16905 [Candidatus Poribacteria bacterium]|nr:hypothetical protein [Candidatus Poribacteria bacterium]